MHEKHKLERELKIEAKRLIVATCGIVDQFFSEELLFPMLRQAASDKWKVEIKPFIWANELIEASRQSQFAFFILFLNPALFFRNRDLGHVERPEPDLSGRGDEINAYEFITSLTQEFNKPVLVISNETKYKSKAGLENAGADAVFWMPFSLKEFDSALRRCLDVASPGLS